jgi:preprotein translocase subunit SecD
MRNLRWRLGIIVAVIALAVWGFYPPNEKINLGLDLKGGVHLVLRVRGEQALRVVSETTMEQMRDQLTRDGQAVGGSEVTGDTSFRVTGVQNDQALRNVSATVADANFNRTSGPAGTYTFALKPNIANQLREETVQQALDTIERRVNALGVAEPVVARHGVASQILVQLPGVSDVQRAKDIISNTAVLELSLVEQGPFPTEESARQAYGNNLPPDLTVMPGSETGTGVGSTVFYVLRRVPVVRGNDLRNAQVQLDENNLPAVGFTLKNDAAARFGTFTEQNIGRNLAVVLDGRVQTAPTIQSRISDSGQITGNYDQQTAQDLALVLRSGALPAALDYLEERTVGPTLGADSVRAGITAGVGGLLLVILFMLFYYKIAGFNALTSVVVNLLILLGGMAYFNAVMTLPGFAGFILTIGMGVDSNVLIFERIKEELALGRSARAAVNAGFDRVWMTIVDTHVASLIAAAFLFQFGTGPIRGFATTLFIGLAANVFTAVFVSRTMFEIILSRRPAGVAGQAQAQALSI